MDRWSECGISPRKNTLPDPQPKQFCLTFDPSRAPTHSGEITEWLRDSSLYLLSPGQTNCIIWQIFIENCLCLTLCTEVLYIWAATWQNQQTECAPSEDSDQPGHPPSLIRVFAVRMKKAWVLSYPLSAQRRRWSDWADAQAALSLCWAHTHFVGFDISRLI